MRNLPPLWKEVAAPNLLRTSVHIQSALPPIHCCAQGPTGDPCVVLLLGPQLLPRSLASGGLGATPDQNVVLLHIAKLDA